MYHFYNVGFLVAAYHGYYSDSDFNQALSNLHYMPVPTLPGDGLLLDECLFTRFNSKKQNQHNPPLLRSTYETSINEMKSKLYQFIIVNEKKTKSLARWTFLLPYFVRVKKQKRELQQQEDDLVDDDVADDDDAAEDG